MSKFKIDQLQKAVEELAELGFDDPPMNVDSTDERVLVDDICSVLEDLEDEEIADLTKPTQKIIKYYKENPVEAIEEAEIVPEPVVAPAPVKEVKKAAAEKKAKDIVQVGKATMEAVRGLAEAVEKTEKAIQTARISSDKPNKANTPKEVALPIKQEVPAKPAKTVKAKSKVEPVVTKVEVIETPIAPVKEKKGKKSEKINGEVRRNRTPKDKNKAMMLVRRMTLMNYDVTLPELTKALEDNGYEANYNSIVVRRTEMRHALDILKDLGKIK